MRSKRILCAILAVAMLLILASCGGDAVGDSGNNNEGGDISAGGDASDNGGNGADSGSASSDDGGGDDGDDGSGGGDSGEVVTSDNGGNGGDSGEIVNSDNSGNSGSSGGDSGNSGGGESGSSGGGGGNSGGGGDSGSGGDGGASSLSGSPEEILDRLVAAIEDAGVSMPMSLPPSEVTADLSLNTIGLEEGDFNRLVNSAAYNLAAIGTFAHQIIVIKANDKTSAGEVKRLVSGTNTFRAAKWINVPNDASSDIAAAGGKAYDIIEWSNDPPPDSKAGASAATGRMFDPKKWICVFPEKVIAVDSGEYVLIVASYSEVVDAAVKAFEEKAGSIGNVITFWEFSGEMEGGFGGGEGIGGMPLLPLP